MQYHTPTREPCLRTNEYYLRFSSQLLLKTRRRVTSARPYFAIMASPASTSSREAFPVLDQEKAPTTNASVSNPPDGGLKAWSVVFGAWCCLFASFGWINCIGIFQNHYQNNELRKYTPSTVAWITSVEVRICIA